MKKIRGNIDAELQRKSVIYLPTGEQEEKFVTICTLKNGVLDSNGGDSRYTTYNAKIEESSHVFICNYQELGEDVKAENTRLYVPKTKRYYDVKYIDNPRELNYHLEIYLNYTGGQNNG